MRLRGVAAADGTPADRWEIGPLQRRHRRAGFSCGVPELDAFLRQFARQNSSKDIGRTYVASPLEDVDDIAAQTLLKSLAPA